MCQYESRLEVMLDRTRTRTTKDGSRIPLRRWMRFFPGALELKVITTVPCLGGEMTGDRPQWPGDRIIPHETMRDEKKQTAIYQSSGSISFLEG